MCSPATLQSPRPQFSLTDVAQPRVGGSSVAYFPFVLVPHPLVSWSKNKTKKAPNKTKKGNSFFFFESSDYLFPDFRREAK